MNIVEDYVKRNNLSVSLNCFLTKEKFERLEDYIGIKFTRKFKDLINNLARVNHESCDINSSIVCDSINPAEFSPFGMGDRSKCLVDNPLRELGDMDEYDECNLTLKEDAGMDETLYPIFDEFGDGHSLICISSNGQVYNYIYELDDDGFGSLLANSLDEFVDKLYIL